MIDETHSSELTSWVSSAQASGCDFPVQNLPLGAFVPGAGGDCRLGVAIGDQVLDLRQAVSLGLLESVSGALAEACRQECLNDLMALDRAQWKVLRRALSALLRQGSPHEERARALLHAQDEVQMRMPVVVGDYTDFYTSIHHATNAGRMFRPDSPLFPNFQYLPVGYHGRASSIVTTGHPCIRPWGQVRPNPQENPIFAPSAKMDFELELAIFVGPGNRMGEPIAISAAEDHVFGMCLLNDWSARDIQAWEYQPLGPFLGKSFMTTISPWVITMEALAPFRKAMPTGGGRPPIPDYLSDPGLDQRSAIDIGVRVSLQTARMREQGLAPALLSTAGFVEQFWSVYQMLVHHASNGCNLRPGDLLGTGTISGTGQGEEGCMLEKSLNGTRPFEVPGGETRKFLEDGDEVIMQAGCSREGFASIGFGLCSGRLKPAAIAR